MGCLDYAALPILIFGSDEKIMDANRAMADFLGTDRKALLERGSVCGIEQFGTICEDIRQTIMDGQTTSTQLKSDGRVFEAVVQKLEAANGLARANGTALFSLTLQDVTKFVSLEEDLVNRNRLLMAINTISTAFITTDEISSVFGRLLERILLVTDLDLCWIVNLSGGEFALRGAAGVSKDLRQKLETGRLDRLHGEVIEDGGPFLVFEGPEIEESYPELKPEGLRFLAAQPLLIGPEKVGALVIGSRRPLALGFELASLINLIGNHVSLIMEKVLLYENAQHLAVTDALTGVFNSRYFFDELGREMARAKRYGGPFSISIFDVDNFKQVNDTYGHQAGDEVLKAAARAMKSVSRQADTVARYGGEEFVVILGSAGKEEALKQATRVKNAVEDGNYLAGNIKITLSGGIATFPEDGTEEKSLLYAADMALYEAKAMGKKQIRPAGGR